MFCFYHFQLFFRQIMFALIRKISVFLMICARIYLEVFVIFNQFHYLQIFDKFLNQFHRITQLRTRFDDG
ncbi:MAG: hypothetical protein BJG00_005525 [Limnothrix sp. CACIAM 69d]|nr:MAG: hypothetical protein BJG00_005525 [Limnothrix sp. CACIAM 69d]